MEEPSKVEEITGWSSNRASTIEDGNNQSDRRNYTLRKNNFGSFGSKDLGY